MNHVWEYFRDIQIRRDPEPGLITEINLARLISYEINLVGNTPIVSRTVGQIYGPEVIYTGEYIITTTVVVMFARAHS
jgi:hypothetical protein